MLFLNVVKYEIPLLNIVNIVKYVILIMKKTQNVVLFKNTVV
jgi:hypothetical protein